MKNKKALSINNLISMIDSKDQVTNKDLIQVKGGKADPPPWIGD